MEHPSSKELSFVNAIVYFCLGLTLCQFMMEFMKH